MYQARRKRESGPGSGRMKSQVEKTNKRAHRCINELNDSSDDDDEDDENIDDEPLILYKSTAVQSPFAATTIANMKSIKVEKV